MIAVTYPVLLLRTMPSQTEGAWVFFSNVIFKTYTPECISMFVIGTDYFYLSHDSNFMNLLIFLVSDLKSKERMNYCDMHCKE